MTGTQFLDWESWADMVVAALDGLADTRRQQMAWTSSGRIFHADPSELCCQLLDDALFEDFIERYEADLGPDFTRQAREVLRAAETFADARLASAAAVLTNADWKLLCSRAALLMAELDMLLQHEDNGTAASGGS